MMFARFSVRIAIAVFLGAAGISSALAGSGAQRDLELVPGARVTIEGGVRVIRPVPLDGRDIGGGAQQQWSGAMMYRGAAFYRVPDLKPPRTVRHRTESDSD
jgi:hypothetical protein